MTVEIEWECPGCGETFWVEQAGIDAGLQCPDCGTRQQASNTTALATLDQLRNRDPLFNDIKQLASLAAAPVEFRHRTFGEWIRGEDIQQTQVHAKLKAGEQAKALLTQRLAILRDVEQVAGFKHEAAIKEAERQRQLLEKRIEIKRLEQLATAGLETKVAEAELERRLLKEQLEIQKLQEEIARREALKPERLRTDQIAEANKQTLLLQEGQPPKKKADDSRKVFAEHRRQLRAVSAERQKLISDFLKEIQKVYAADLEDDEKAVRIRTSMEAYKQDIDVLPAAVREFVFAVEAGAENDDA